MYTFITWFHDHKERWLKIFSYIKLQYTSGDKDWDYMYLVNVLEWKLRGMRTAFVKDRYVVEVDRRIKQIDYAIFLIIRWRDDPIEKEELKKHYEKWGATKRVLGEPDEIGAVPLSWEYPNGDPKEAHDEWWETMMRSKKRKADARNRLFKHVAKYIEGWWT